MGFSNLGRRKFYNNETTINIKGQMNISSFLNLIRNFDYVEILDVEEDNAVLPIEHKVLLDERLKRIENDKTSFKNWDLVKRKYEGKTISY